MLNLSEAGIIQHLIEMKMVEILSEGGGIMTLRPFIFRNQPQARSIKELCDLCIAHPMDGQFHFSGDHFAPWLSSLGEDELVVRLAEIRQMPVSLEEQYNAFVQALKVSCANSVSCPKCGGAAVSAPTTLFSESAESPNAELPPGFLKPAIKLMIGAAAILLAALIIGRWLPSISLVGALISSLVGLILGVGGLWLGSLDVRSYLKRRKGVALTCKVCQHRWTECAPGQHRWEFCTCRLCGKSRDENHQWLFCYCLKCNKQRDTGHVWGKDHLCKGCGKPDPSWSPSYHLCSHDFIGCKCTKCGEIRDHGHRWTYPEVWKYNKRMKQCEVCREWTEITEEDSARIRAMQSNGSCDHDWVQEGFYSVRCSKCGLVETSDSR